MKTCSTNKNTRAESQISGHGHNNHKLAVEPVFFFTSSLLWNGGPTGKGQGERRRNRSLKSHHCCHHEVSLGERPHGLEGGNNKDVTTKMLDGSRWQAWVNPKISLKYGKEEKGVQALWWTAFNRFWTRMAARKEIWTNLGDFSSQRLAF